jgi:hypothetical protein
MPVCITGMHCSGTSTVARMLHQCGLNLGTAEGLVPADGITREVAQHVGFVDLDDALLAAMGGGWDHPPAAGQVVADLGALATLLDRARSLIGAFGAEPWGWSDPRACLTMPLWQAVVPGLRVVIVVGDPLEVARALAVRNGLSRALSLDLWLAYYQRLLQSLLPERRIVVMDTDVVADASSQVRRLVSFAGLMPGAEMVETASSSVDDESVRHRDGIGGIEPVELPERIATLFEQLKLEAAGAGTVSAAAAFPVIGSGDGADFLQRELAELSRRQNLLINRFAELEATVAGGNRGLSDEDAAALAPWTGWRPSRSDADLDELVGPYGDLVVRIRDAVTSAVPPGATVAVVSRGDDELIRFPGRQGWHFPMTEDGVYAGHYPGDSDEAIEHLEQLRRKGAEYIVFPRTGQWWLAHYAAFADYLRTRYEVVETATEDCVIFALASSGEAQSLDADADLDERYLHLRSEMAAIITSILPVTATVLVVSHGDDDMLRLDGRTAWHFPQTEDGDYAGHHPADDVEAINHLEVLRAAGAEYLVFPGTETWWLQHYAGFRRHLDQRYRRMVNQEEVCIAYDLSDSSARRSQRNGTARKVAARG